LPEYGWGPSSSTAVPAGQDGGDQTQILPNAQYDENTAVNNQSLLSTEHDNDSSQALNSGISDPSVATSAAAEDLQCQICQQLFTQRHQLNRHFKQKHEKPNRCDAEGCDAAFGFKRDLERHINSKHGGGSRFYCQEEGCKYSIENGNGFSRKDHLDRHVEGQHSRYISLPVPEQWPSYNQ